ncbi:RNA-binding protein [Anaeramoeba ignava]|uniref:RNA-binding protein n=1 Tax=Anaeramoeba ignava TaxID=1746090 RepID=A0A9Q0LDE9_ANAIG|nr:RNA-binding protein [Anaeramoeba ignava]
MNFFSLSDFNPSLETNSPQRPTTNKQRTPQHGIPKKQTNRNKREVFVGHLSSDVTEDDLYELFQSAGSILRVRILKNKNGESKRCGFVEFTNTDSAENAIQMFHKKVFLRDTSRPIFVEYSHPDPKEAKEKELANKSRKFSDSEPVVLYLANLPNGVQKSEIESLFSAYGKIIGVDLHGNQPHINTKNVYAFVRMESRRAAQNAIKQLDQSKPFQDMILPMVVRMRETIAERETRMSTKTNGDSSGKSHKSRDQEFSEFEKRQQEMFLSSGNPLSKISPNALAGLAPLSYSGLSSNEFGTNDSLLKALQSSVYSPFSQLLLPQNPFAQTDPTQQLLLAQLSQLHSIDPLQQLRSPLSQSSDTMKLLQLLSSNENFNSALAPFLSDQSSLLETSIIVMMITKTQNFLITNPNPRKSTDSRNSHYNEFENKEFAQSPLDQDYAFENENIPEQNDPFLNENHSPKIPRHNSKSQSKQSTSPHLNHNPNHNPKSKSKSKSKLKSKSNLSQESKNHPNQNTLTESEQIEKEPDSNIFVHGLPLNFTDSDLAILFSIFRITNAYIFPDKSNSKTTCSGIVSFANQDEASKAIKDMNGILINNQRLRLLPTLSDQFFLL